LNPVFSKVTAKSWNLSLWYTVGLEFVMHIVCPDLSGI